MKEAVKKFIVSYIESPYYVHSLKLEEIMKVNEFDIMQAHEYEINLRLIDLMECDISIYYQLISMDNDNHKACVEYCKYLYRYIKLKESKKIGTNELSKLANISRKTITRFENLYTIVSLQNYLKLMIILEKLPNKKR